MSLKKEASGRRSVQVEVEVPGTPEQVWEAIATGPGITAWFVPTRVEEENGVPKKLICNFGPGMESAADIKDWNPPHRLTAENSWGPGMPPVATEWTVEARGGGKCVVRVVHSLFASTDAWDNQLESTEMGWPTFFRILKLYLTHFRGQPCSTIQVMGGAQGTVLDAWGKLTGALGITGSDVNQRCKTQSGVPDLAGVIDSVSGGTHPGMLLRVDQPAPGVASLGAFGCGGIMVMVSMYLYGEKAAGIAKREEAAWRAWMGARFPMAAPVGSGS